MRPLYMWLLALSTGCSASTASLAPVHIALVDSSALAATAELALTSITSTSSTCASVTTACTVYPCTGAATIDVGPNCPLPFGGETTGSVNVTGSFTSADEATFTSEFVGVDISTVPIEVVSAKSLDVTRSGDTITVIYDAANVTTSSGIIAASASWNATFASDGSVTITGGRQEIALGVTDAAISNAVLAPSCRLNPISGTATVANESLTDIESDNITFHMACDGRADVQSATGGTKSIPL